MWKRIAFKRQPYCGIDLKPMMIAMHSQRFVYHKTKGVDWSKRKKALRIVKHNHEHGDLYQAKEKNESESNVENETSLNENETNLSENENENEKGKEAMIRPALFTNWIKKTQHPRKLLEVWLRDRKLCNFDEINCAAAITHLGNLSLKCLQKDEIYDKTMSWGLIRLIRDVKELEYIEKYDMRQIANIMWSLGILASNDKNTHQDMRKLANYLIKKMYEKQEIRRQCNVTHLSDILWSMHRLGLNENEWFYPWCIKLYVKLDTDIGCTPDAITNIAMIYAMRHNKFYSNNLSKNKDIINDSLNNSLNDATNLWNQFWFKLWNQFCDDFMLMEVNCNHIANMFWSMCIAKPYDDSSNDSSNDGMISDNESKQIIELNGKKLLDFVYANLDSTDGQTLSILLYCVTKESKYPIFEACKQHQLFLNEENNIVTRIYQLLLSQNITNLSIENMKKRQNVLDTKWTVPSNPTIEIKDCINILQSCVEMKQLFPNYVLNTMIEKTKQQLRYCNYLSKNELISLINSLYLLQLGDESLYYIIGNKLNDAAKNCPKLQWHCTEFISLLSTINQLNDKYDNKVLLSNLDLIQTLLNRISLTRQHWRGNWKRLSQLDQLLKILQHNLKHHKFLSQDTHETRSQLALRIQSLQQNVKKHLEMQRNQKYL